MLREACAELWIKLAEHKTEGPAIRVTFLGIMIDTTTGQLSLPQEKLAHLQSLLTDWGDRKSCSKKDLESLIGTLNHACKVILPFLRRMIDLLKQHKVHYRIRLNREFCSDLQWWTNFIATWNGVSYLLVGPTSEFASDASGSWWFGAHINDSWFQIEWDEQSSPFSKNCCRSCSQWLRGAGSGRPRMYSATVIIKQSSQYFVRGRVNSHS